MAASASLSELQLMSISSNCGVRSLKSWLLTLCGRGQPQGIVSRYQQVQGRLKPRDIQSTAQVGAAANIEVGAARPCALIKPDFLLAQ